MIKDMLHHLVWSVPQSKNVCVVAQLYQGQISSSVSMCSRPKQNKLENQSMLQDRNLHRWKVYSLIVHHTEGKDKRDKICTFLCRSEGWKSTLNLLLKLTKQTEEIEAPQSSTEVLKHGRDYRYLLCQRCCCGAVFREPKSSWGAWVDKAQYPYKLQILAVTWQ